MYQYRNSLGGGAQKGTLREIVTDTANLRFDDAFNLGPDWKVALRTDLPASANTRLTADNPEGYYVAGLGDADLQAALIHTLNDRWKVGSGIRLIAPTGNEALGSGKWRILPIVGARYAWPELNPGSYLEPSSDTTRALRETQQNGKSGISSSHRRSTSGSPISGLLHSIRAQTYASISVTPFPVRPVNCFSHSTRESQRTSPTT